MKTSDNIAAINLQTPSSSLISAVRYLLRPLVKLLLTHSITFPFMSNVLKSIYVEVATEEFQIQGKPQTDSRDQSPERSASQGCKELAAGTNSGTDNPPLGIVERKTFEFVDQRSQATG